MQKYHDSGTTFNNDRFHRDILLNAEGLVTQIELDRWIVRSEYEQSMLYMVTSRGCTCPDQQDRQTICKHIWAAFFDGAVVVNRLRGTDSLEVADHLLELFHDQVRPMPEGIKATINQKHSLAVNRLATPPAQAMVERQVA